MSPLPGLFGEAWVSPRLAPGATSRRPFGAETAAEAAPTSCVSISSVCWFFRLFGGGFQADDGRVERADLYIFDDYHRLAPFVVEGCRLRCRGRYRGYLVFRLGWLVRLQ